MNLRPNIQSRLKSIAFHPFVLALFPIIALLAENIEQVNYQDSIRALIAALVMTVVQTLILFIIFKNWHKAAGVSSLFLILFFSYGHVYALSKTTTIAGMIIGRHRVLAPLWIVSFTLGAWIIAKKLSDMRAITKTMNQLVVLALLFPIFRLGLYFYDNQVRGYFQPVEAREPDTDLTISKDAALPDIYYIILDGHARADVLQRRFDHDNTSFIEFLKDRGFVVAEQSQSNYLWTHLSLASSLNMDYLQELNLHLKPGGFRGQTYELIRHSLVRRILENLGYSTVSLASGFFASEFHDADYYLSPQITGFDQLQVVGGINEFEGLLIHTSAVKILTDFEILQAADWAAEALNYSWRAHRQVILGAFNNLEWIPNITGPKFIYVHIVSPHRPYVFDRAGNEVTSREPFLFAPPDVDWKEEVPLYKDQLIYIDSKVEEVIDAILARSETRPIIILQSDHGSILGFDWDQPDKIGVSDRAAILNAYYLPDSCSSSIYPTITPVNTFRSIFDCVFGTSYGQLEDVTYFDDRAGTPAFTKIQDLFR